MGISKKLVASLLKRLVDTAPEARYAVSEYSISEIALMGDASLHIDKPSLTENLIDETLYLGESWPVSSNSQLKRNKYRGLFSNFLYYILAFHLRYS